MRPAVAVQAARPTAAALPWTPVLVAGAAAVGTVLLVRALSDRPADVAAIGAAALASAAVAALQDRADALLAPLPTSRLARRLLRLTLVAVVVVPLVAALERLSTTAVDLGPVTVALVLTGLAAAAWLPTGRAGLVAAVLPVSWVGTTTLLDDTAGPLDVWAEHPWPLAAAATAVILVGRHR